MIPVTNKNRTKQRNATVSTFIDAGRYRRDSASTNPLTAAVQPIKPQLIIDSQPRQEPARHPVRVITPAAANRRSTIRYRR